MANKYSKLVTLSPCVLRAEDRAREITLHAREAYARTMLDGVERIRLIRRGSPSIKWRKWRSWNQWLQSIPPSEFRRLENGDLIVNVNTPEEGEYSLCLDKTDGNGGFAESCAFSLYALEDDLFALTPFKGDFHMHSNRSDGAHSPEYVAATCRRVGLDFMALTDHRLYDPSLIARKAMAELGCDMLVCPGEEVHLPDNAVHIINFGAGASVNKLAADDEASYMAEVEERMKTVPEKYDAVTRFQVAASEWAFDRIREFGGVAMFCHPYWKPSHHNYIGDDAISLIMERQKFDALEVISGFELDELEDNMLSLSLWQEALAKGRKIPVVGVSDSHDCDVSLTGWYYTVAFAEELTFESLAEALRDGRGVAVYSPPGHFPLVVGPFRLTRFVYFLLREVYPFHDELCRVEGEIMRRALAGEEPEAREELARRRGKVGAFMAGCWER